MGKDEMASVLIELSRRPLALLRNTYPPEFDKNFKGIVELYIHLQRVYGAKR